jgi:threonine dehydratase
MTNFQPIEPVFPPLDIWKARYRLQNYVARTPLVFSQALSRRTGARIYLKMECWQTCGCFKIRGAINKILSLTRKELDCGLVTASSGNHAIAVAYAAGLVGSPDTTIFLPKKADPTKVAKLGNFNARLVFHGENYLEAYDRAQQYCSESAGTYIHSHADPQVISGQGTVGLEILNDLPDVEFILVPVGGGGLISGVAAAVKSIAPSVRVIGVEPTAAPSAYQSLRDGKCYDRIDIQPSIADGLLGGIGLLPYQIIKLLVDEVVLVDDDEIGYALAIFQQDEQLMIEAASAVGLSTLLSHKLELVGRNVVLILTSRNIDYSKFNQIVKKYG